MHFLHLQSDNLFTWKINSKLQMNEISLPGKLKFLPFFSLFPPPLRMSSPEQDEEIHSQRKKPIGFSAFEV